MGNNIDELSLLHQLKNGDEDAFVTIYRMYWKTLFNQAYHRLKDEQDVKELMQDLYSELWQNRATLNIHTSLLGYLQSALRFKILNLYKREELKERFVTSVRIKNCVSGDAVDEAVNYAELSRAYDEAVTLLPVQRRKVYDLKFHHGMSYAEIAQSLEISVRTVEKHISMAIKAIRNRLQNFR